MTQLYIWHLKSPIPSAAEMAEIHSTTLSHTDHVAHCSYSEMLSLSTMFACNDKYNINTNWRGGNNTTTASTQCLQQLFG